MGITNITWLTNIILRFLLSSADEVLGELQFSFVCFLVGQNLDAFEQWKQLLKMFCTSDDALANQTLLYMTLISDLHFQVYNIL